MRKGVLIMNRTNSSTAFALVALGLAALIIGSTGCATKKYVRNSVQESVQPLQVGLKNTEEKTDANAEQIRSVDRRAESGIAQAQNAASQANEAASRADQHAQSAHQLAQQGVDAAGRAERTANNLDNYEPSRRATVLFGLNKSTLTTDDKQSLDQLIQSVKALKHYVIQVQGYTDRTGPEQYNLQLSERRADAVVRYLTLNGNIPLVKIYTLGYGNASPVAPNDTRAGRAKNRRVDVVVLVPQIAGEPGVPTAQTSSAGSTP